MTKDSTPAAGVPQSPVGRALEEMTASFARTPSITATVFSPIARRTSSITAGAFPSQTALVGR